MNKAKIIAALSALLLALGLGGYSIVKNTNLSKSFDNTLHIVERVIDGDTVEIEDGIRVRLIGINSPDEGECYFSEAKEFTKNLLEKKSVRLDKDISGEDEYGRLLRYVIIPSEMAGVDNTIANNEIIRNGYALRVQSPPDNRYRDLFATAEEEAKREKRGMWDACQSVNMEQTTTSEREIDTPPPSPECTIKGNISEKGYGKTYLVPGCDNYLKVKVDMRKGEQYFCNEEEAQKAGFRKADNCPQ